MPVRTNLACLLLALALLTTTGAGRTSHFPVEELKPGMVAHGETVFAGTAREPFTARIIGVLENVMGPHRHLILARLEGGPLAETGVIAGMSGSPVFIDGRLVGAVSYSLGQFPKEPIAGITPIAEMVEFTARGASAPASSAPTRLPIDEAALVDDLRARMGLGDRFADRAEDVRAVGGVTPSDALALRRIATPLALSGFSENASARLGQVLGRFGLRAVAGFGGGAAPAEMPTAPLQGGDALGISLVSGDLALSATGTVTWVDGQRVYAFGHPLVNLGPVSMPMTRAYVHVVLPSLMDSFKIASPGPVIGKLEQDRSTAVAGTLGPGPRTIPISVQLNDERTTPKRFAFSVAQDQTLTPTLSFFSVLSVLQSHEREAGGATYQVRGQIKVRSHGAFTFDDAFAGDMAAGTAAGYVITPLALMARTDIAALEIEGVEVSITATDRPRTLAIERVWLDSARVRPGDTVTAKIAMRPWRGQEVIKSVPITIPANAKGSLTLVVADSNRVAPYDSRDLRQVTAVDTVPQMLRLFSSLRRNSVLYVRLLNQDAGAVVSGEALTGLPPSVLGVLEADRTGAGNQTLRQSTVGAWDLPVDGVATGLRQVTVPIENN